MGEDVGRNSKDAQPENRNADIAEQPTLALDKPAGVVPEETPDKELGDSIPMTRETVPKAPRNQNQSIFRTSDMLTEMSMSRLGGWSRFREKCPRRTLSTSWPIR